MDFCKGFPNEKKAAIVNQGKVVMGDVHQPAFGLVAGDFDFFLFFIQ
ncbi:MAG: hypothetical protein J6T41_01110 [Neisseriaceae bacterium]|nr:hypothetical protein [Neisseriaceae bacterium]